MNYIKILSLVLLANLSTNYSAQETRDTEEQHRKDNSRDAKHKVVPGLKAGFNHASVWDESGTNFVAGSKTGYAAGVFLAIPIGGLLGFQPELQVGQKGFSGSGVVAGEVYQLTRTTTHLDVPLQAMLKPFSFLTFLGGVNYSFLLAQKDQFTFGSKYEEQNAEFENDNIRRNTLGLIFGADVNLWHLVLSGRAGWDMTANHGDGTSSTPRYKNLWVQGTVGFRLY